MATGPLDATSTDRLVPAIQGHAGDPGTGIFGETAGGGHGVRGHAHTIGHGVHGDSPDGTGVAGVSATFIGVHGQSASNTGVFGESVSGIGVFGKGGQLAGRFEGSVEVTGHIAANSIDKNVPAVQGSAGDPGTGVFGQTTGGGHGVRGHAHTIGHGVHGDSPDGTGVAGVSATFIGVHGQSTSNTGVFGESVSGIGLFGKGGRLAGRFEGDVEVTGDLRLTNADCAEEFDIADPDSAEPGTVMVLSEGGQLRESHQAYDKRVAGVISGAGDYKPGIVLDKQHTSANRRPIALVGKVYCKVDAGFGAIEVGDLLTSSTTLGHAMKTTDPFKAFGAVIGKALRPLSSGQGLIPILIALQ